MANDGIITRKELITDEAIRWGSEYEKELNKAIAKNKEFIDSVKQYSEILKSLKGVQGNSDFQNIKKKEIEVLKQASTAWKEQTNLENQLISTIKRRELATESTNRKLIEERTLLQQTNKEIKKEVLERINQADAYKRLETALGNVRGEAKRVKAEMFLLEQQGKANTQEYNNLRLRSIALTAQTNVLDRGIKDIDSSLGLHQRNVGNYSDALTNISPIFGRVNSQLATMGLSLDQLAASKAPFKELIAGVTTLGKSIGAFLISPVGLALIAVGSLFALLRANKDTVIEFNSGLLDVGKTTGIADEELRALGGDIIKLSRDLKTVGTPALLEYATVAGQLGVKGTQNIVKFTKALAQLETASNISGEEGASQIARLLTLTDGGVENIQDFGDEIVKLGNNFAATEKEILENATAIAQNTGLYKVGRQDILAYATASKAVGVEAELTGSTIGRTLGIMEKSIRTGKNIATVANLTNQSVEELKESFADDASSVLFSFVEGLNAVDESGGSVNAQLESLGITSVRDQRVLASLATGGFGTLSKAMNDVREASGALAEEFETAQGKLENQFKRTGIAWDNLVLSLEDGQGVIAKLSALIVGQFADTLEKLTVFIDELGIAWNTLMSYFEDTDGTDKAETSFSDLLKVLFSVEFFTNNIRLAFYLLLKLFLVDLPNAFGLWKKNVELAKTSFELFTDFIIEIAPLLQKAIKQALNPFEEVDTDALAGAFLKFKNKLVDENKKLTEDLDEENKKRLDDFNARYGTARGNAGQSRALQEAEKEAEERRKIQEAEDEEAKKRREQYLKEQKKLSDAEFALYQFRIKNAMDLNKEILEDDKSTLEQRIEAFSDNAQLERDLITETAKKKLKDISQYNDEVRDLTNEEIRILINGGEIEKELTDDELLALEEYQASVLANTRRFNKERQQLIDEEISLRKKLIESSLTGINTSENDEVRSVTDRYAADLEAFRGTEEEKLRLKEEFERRILDIERQSTVDELQLRLNTLESLLELDEISAEKRIELENEVSKAKLELANLELDYKEEILDKAFELEEENADRIKELYEGLADASIDLTNTIFDARIEKINEEIDANNERYDKWLENENLTEEQRDEIEAKRDEKNKELEKKRQKELIKQELFNRTIAIAQIATDLAKTITAINLAAVAMDALAPYAFGAVGATYRGLQIGLAVGTAAIQTANVLAAPLPKYEFGTDDHKGGFAHVAEKRPEVILEPNKEPYVVSKHSILDLPKHTQVVPSLNEYDKLQRAAMMTSLDIQLNTMGVDNSKQSFDDRYSAEIVDELKKMNKKKMNVIVNQSKIDINHAVWRSNNIKW